MVSIEEIVRLEMKGGKTLTIHEDRLFVDCEKPDEDIIDNI